MDSINKSKLTVSFLLIISLSLLVISLLQSISAIGSAFYIKERIPAIRDPMQEELPQDMENVNIIF